jgi:hypothetical protein
LVTPTILLAFPGSRNLERQVQEGNPVKAVEFLKRSGLSGRLLNDYTFGGYLIWAAPEKKVFIDGRGDIFESAGVFADYCKLMSLSEDPKLLLEKYRIEVCLLPQHQGISQVLPLLGWRKIYSDKMSVVFARSAAAGH